MTQFMIHYDSATLYCTNPPSDPPPILSANSKHPINPYQPIPNQQRPTKISTHSSPPKSYSIHPSPNQLSNILVTHPLSQPPSQQPSQPWISRTNMILIAVEIIPLECGYYLSWTATRLLTGWVIPWCSHLPCPPQG